MVVMGLEEQLMHTASKEISNEIDFRILVDLCIADGWTKVVLTRRPSAVYIEMREWCRVQGFAHHTRSLGRNWLFKEEKLATLFLLRWS